MAKRTVEWLRQFVTFRIETDLFGFDIRIVKEVNQHTDIAAVPLAPKKIRGVINIRGQIVLVVDIAVQFGRPPRPVTPDSQLVIMKTRQELGLMRDLGDRASEDNWEDKPVAFLVDTIGDIVAVENKVIDRVPPHIPEQIAEFINGVVRIDGELLIFLEAKRLLLPESVAVASYPLNNYWCDTSNGVNNVL